MSVSDRLGAITNITARVVVAPYGSATPGLAAYLTRVRSLYTAALVTTQEQQVQQLGVLALDLSRFDTNSEQSCAATGACSGGGSCDDSATARDTDCACEDGRHLGDCSADAALYDEYLTLKSQLYGTLNALRSQVSSKPLQDQVLKSVNSLLAKNDLGLVLSAADASAGITDMLSIVAKQKAQMQSLRAANLLNTGDSAATRASQSANAILGKSLEFVNGLVGSVNYGVANAHGRRRRGLRALAGEDVNATMRALYEMVQNISDAVLTATLPNSDPVVFEGASLQQTIQKATSKTVAGLFASSESTISVDGAQQSASSAASFDAGAQDGATNTVYNVNQAIFTENPLRFESAFPYPDQSQYLVLLQISYENSSALINITKSVPIFYPIPDGQNFSQQVCIYQTQNGSWSNEGCAAQLIQSAGVADQTQCQCEQLGPQTVVDDLNDLFLKSKLKDIFSEKGLSAFVNFPFYRSIIFYVFLAKTALVIVFMWYGHRQDQRKRLTVEPLRGQEGSDGNIDRDQEQAKEHEQEGRARRLGSGSPSTLALAPDAHRLLNTPAAFEISLNALNSRNEFQLSQVHQALEVKVGAGAADGAQPPPPAVEEMPDQSALVLKRPRKRKVKMIFQIDHEAEQAPVVQNFTLHPSLIPPDCNADGLPKTEQILSKELDGDAEQKREEAEKANAKAKRRKIREGVILLHDIFGIFLVYDPLLSRPVRFVLLYLKILGLIAIAAIFSQQLSQIQAVLVTILGAVVITVPISLMQRALKAENRALNVLVVVMCLGLFCLCFYVCLTAAALMGVDESNQWAVNYMTAFCADTFMMVR